MKVGDLVKVLFPYEANCIGVFMGWDDPDGYGRDRAYVFWDGGIYSTPIDQVELLNESR